MHQNNEATEQLEEVSGRWLRDQLRGVGDDPPEPSPADLDGDGESEASSGSHGAAGASDATSALLDGLAAGISSAIAKPMRGLESQREARQQKLEAALQEISGKLGDAFVEIAKVREQAASAGLRADQATDTAKREIEAARKEFGDDAEQLRATGADLRDGFNRLAEEVGRLQEKVREQHERLDALRFRETQRAKALTELEKASSSLKDALSAAAALSGSNDDSAAGASNG